MKTGIKFKPCNIEQSEAERWRMEKYKENLIKKYGKPHWFPELTHLNDGWQNSSYGKLKQLLDQDRIECKQFTGRGMQAKAAPIREGVCPCKPDTKIEDFDKFKAWLHEKGIEVISINIHRDEGHYDEYTGEFIHNYHAHVVADWFNHKTGRCVSLNSRECSEMQDVIADSLGMERGTPAELTKARHLTPLEFKAKKIGEDIEELEKRKQQLAKEEIMKQEEIDNRIRMKESELKEVERKANVVNKMLSRSYSDESRRIADLAVKYEQLQGRGSGWIESSSDEKTVDLSGLNIPRGRWHQTTAEDVKAEFIKTAKALVPHPQNEEAAKAHYQIFASSVAINCISRLSSTGLEDVDKLFQEAIDEDAQRKEQREERHEERQQDEQRRPRLHL